METSHQTAELRELGSRMESRKRLLSGKSR